MRDESISEGTGRPLVDAAYATGDLWQKALGVLYMNGSVMVLSEISSTVLVSMSGKSEQATASLSLIQGKATTAIAPFAADVIRTFVPAITSLAQDRKFVDAAEKGEEEKVMGAIMTNFKGIFENFDISKKLIQSGFTFSDLIVVMIFQTLATFREQQIHVIAKEAEYEQLILLLTKLNLASPRLQVGICPNCANYQLVISSHSPFLDRCQHCGYQWVSITLYTLEDQFSRLKIRNSDLPLFISAYLRNKLSYLSGLQEVKIHPNAVVQVGRSKQEEIDVYLPRFQLAFECKVFRDPFGSYSGPHAGSIEGELRNKIAKLSKLGVTDVVIVTNLTDEATKKLTEELLSEEDVKVRLNILSRNPLALVASLNAISSDIGEKISKTFSQKLEWAKDNKKAAEPESS